jgi:hypothetical protein
MLVLSTQGSNVFWLRNSLFGAATLERSESPIGGGADSIEDGDGELLQPQKAVSAIEKAIRRDEGFNCIVDGTPKRKDLMVNFTSRMRKKAIKTHNPP